MKGLVYISRATEPFTGKELKKLAASASKNNIKLGITGYLSYDDEDCFIQYIEGDEEAIQTLFDSIYKDTRHRITHYVRHEIEHRKFPQWNMRLIIENEFKEIHDMMISHLFHISSAPSMSSYKNRLIWNTVESLADTSH